MKGNIVETWSRYFKVTVRYAYPWWKQVFVEVITCPEEEGCETLPKSESGRDDASFWLEYFDFPLVDSTYLNRDERYSVILNGFKEGEYGEEEEVEITLLYYPASYAGLKEKTFYNNQLMRHLLESDLFGTENRVHPLPDGSDGAAPGSTPGSRQIRYNRP